MSKLVKSYRWDLVRRLSEIITEPNNSILIHKYTSDGVLIDTESLFILLAGIYFKRFNKNHLKKNYDIEDFDLFGKFLLKYGIKKLFITPHVLTELFYWIAKCKDKEFTEFSARNLSLDGKNNNFLSCFELNLDKNIILKHSEIANIDLADVGLCIKLLDFKSIITEDCDVYRICGDLRYRDKLIISIRDDIRNLPKLMK